jgi:hypothetical protein
LVVFSKEGSMEGKFRMGRTVLVLAALVAFVATPAVGAMVYDAMNSHKVDGKHAVGAGASLSARSGKLVATNSKGRLPNNIIKKATDADKLDGKDSTDFVDGSGMTTVSYFGPWFSTAPGVVTQHAEFTEVQSASPGTAFLSPSPPQLPSVLLGKRMELEKVQICYDATDPDVGIVGTLEVDVWTQADPGSSAGSHVFDDNVNLHDASCRILRPEDTSDPTDGPLLLDPISFVHVQVPVQWVAGGGDFTIERMTYFLRRSDTDA